PLHPSTLPSSPTRRSSDLECGRGGGTILAPSQQSPPTRLATLATLPANGREGKGSRVCQQMCIPRRVEGEGIHPATAGINCTTADRKSTRLNSSHLVISYA